ncbi:MAG: dynamin family protein [Candidatus Aenigmatarchaeota archaeon]
MPYEVLIVFLIIALSLFLVKLYKVKKSEIKHEPKEEIEINNLKDELEVAVNSSETEPEDVQKQKQFEFEGMQDFVVFLQELSKTGPSEPRKEYGDVVKYVRKEIDEVKSFILNFDIYDKKDEAINSIEEFFSEWVEKVNKPWIRNRSIVAFIGKFSAGKSSIINSLLGENLLPVDVTPTTAVPTYISYDTQEVVCKVEESDGEIKNISRDLLKRISHENFKSMPLSLFIKNLVIGYPNDVLKDISILDTPGYDSVSYKDKRRTIEAISESDVIFWVVDVNDGAIKADSLNFIKEYISSKPFYVIINKTDLKPPSEVGKVKSRIEEQLASNGIKYKDIFTFSIKDNNSKSSLSEKIKEIASSHNNNREDIYSFLKGYINDFFAVIKDEEANLKEKIVNLEEEINELNRRVKDYENELMETIRDSFDDTVDYIRDLNQAVFVTYRLTKENYNKLFAKIRRLANEIEKDIFTTISELKKVFHKIEDRRCEISRYNDEMRKLESYKKSLQRIRAELWNLNEKLIKEGLL